MIDLSLVSAKITEDNKLEISVGDDQDGVTVHIDLPLKSGEIRTASDIIIDEVTGGLRHRIYMEIAKLPVERFG